jgi:hypothetical protein
VEALSAFHSKTPPTELTRAPEARTNVGNLINLKFEAPCDGTVTVVDADEESRVYQVNACKKLLGRKVSARTNIHHRSSATR